MKALVQNVKGKGFVETVKKNEYEEICKSNWDMMEKCHGKGEIPEKM